jgi:putative heme-binding domain-containing protein
MATTQRCILPLHRVNRAHRLPHSPWGGGRTGIAWAYRLLLSLLTGWCHLVAAQDAYRLDDARLKAVPIISDQRESLLGIAIDGSGRMFIGGREALFVHEPDASGGYGPAQELYRFPKDTWVFDICIRGHDLYVLTVAALYYLPGAVLKRTGNSPTRLLWGDPIRHPHQGFHGMAIGPDGDLYISLGDEAWGYGDFNRRPDHWGYCTLFHGPAATPSPFVGSGGVLRLSPDGSQLTIIANGTRNDCGLAFDHQWNLFGTDNDHESMPNEYVPGRLLHITPHAYFSWPRGWMPEKQPWRSDMLATMASGLGRYVPVGMTYYDDALLPASYRNALYVARWCTHAIAGYPLENADDTFRSSERSVVAAAGDARPVSVAVGRGGRLFVVLCHMGGNDASPIYRSDVVMLTLAGDQPTAPFASWDETQANADALYAALASPEWSRHLRAHIEIERRGGDLLLRATSRLSSLASSSPEASSLIWLAAASRSQDAQRELDLLAHHADVQLRTQAIRALARFGGTAASAELFAAILRDPAPSVRLAGLAGCLDQGAGLPFDAVVGAASEDMTYIRQLAAMILAQRASVAQLTGLCDDPRSSRRRAGVLAAGFRLTMPPWDQAPPASTPLDLWNDGYTVHYADATEDLRTKGRIGVFTVADAWAKLAKQPDDEAIAALLDRRLYDADGMVAKQAAFFLHLLDDQRFAAHAAQVLGLPGSDRHSGVPLAGISTTGTTEMPPEFRGADWTAAAARGNADAGKLLFQTRGCTVCHSIQAGDHGGGGPSLQGAGSRFSVAYLVESILLPNKVVSPLFRWSVLTLANGSTVTGLVVGETGSEIDVLLPAAIHQLVKKQEVTARRIEDRSPMPEGLIHTPEELRDLLSFLLSQK